MTYDGYVCARCRQDCLVADVGLAVCHRCHSPLCLACFYCVARGELGYVISSVAGGAIRTEGTPYCSDECRDAERARREIHGYIHGANL